MALGAEVDPTSYDPMFPSRDFVTRKGFGSPIASQRLQGTLRKQANLGR